MALLLTRQVRRLKSERLPSKQSRIQSKSLLRLRLPVPSHPCAAPKLVQEKDRKLEIVIRDIFIPFDSTRHLSFSTDGTQASQSEAISFSLARTVVIRSWLAASGGRCPGSASRNAGAPHNFAFSWAR